MMKKLSVLIVVLSAVLARSENQADLKTNVAQYSKNIPGFLSDEKIDKHNLSETEVKQETKAYIERKRLEDPKPLENVLSSKKLSDRKILDHNVQKETEENPEAIRLKELADTNDGIDDPLRVEQDTESLKDEITEISTSLTEEENQNAIVSEEQNEKFFFEMTGDPKLVKSKNVFSDILNDSIYQVIYASSNPLELGAFLITNAVWSVKSYFSYESSTTSLIARNYNVLPAYLSESNKAVIEQEIQSLIQKYHKDVLMYDSYISSLGVQNFRNIAGKIFHEYDGTQDIFTMLLNDDNFKNALKNTSLSDEEVLRLAEVTELIVNDLLDIKLHARYSTALVEFKKEFHTSTNFLKSYNDFYFENAERHYLHAEDYTIMMRYFINNLYTRSIAEGQMRETYNISRSITDIALDNSFVARAAEEHFSEITERLHKTKQESDIIYEAVKYSSSNDMLKTVLNSGTSMGTYARYGVIGLQLITSYAILGGASIVGAVGVIGNYIGIASTSRKFVNNDTVAKRLMDVHSDVTVTVPENAIYNAEHNEKTTNKIMDQINRYKNSNEFSLHTDIWGAMIDSNKYKMDKLRNARTLIAVKPTVVHKAVMADLPSILTQAENIDEIASNFKRNFRMKEESVKHDTPIEKAQKVFNKYLDVVLSFATGMQLFKPITEKDKKAFIDNYVDHSVQIFKTAVYNNFYEEFKKEYSRTNTSLDDCFNNYWADHASEFVEPMYRERFNEQVDYAADFKTANYQKREHILRQECFKYVHEELQKEQNLIKNKQLLSKISGAEVTDDSLQLDGDKATRVRSLNPSAISY